MVNDGKPEERGGISAKERKDLLDWFHWALAFISNSGVDYPGNYDIDLGKLEKLILGNQAETGDGKE